MSVLAVGGCSHDEIITTDDPAGDTTPDLDDVWTDDAWTYDSTGDRSSADDISNTTFTRMVTVSGFTMGKMGKR